MCSSGEIKARTVKNAMMISWSWRFSEGLLEKSCCCVCESHYWYLRSSIWEHLQAMLDWSELDLEEGSRWDRSRFSFELAELQTAEDVRNCVWWHLNVTPTPIRWSPCSHQHAVSGSLQVLLVTPQICRASWVFSQHNPQRHPAAVRQAESSSSDFLCLVSTSEMLSSERKPFFQDFTGEKRDSGLNRGLTTLGWRTSPKTLLHFWMSFASRAFLLLGRRHR